VTDYNGFGASTPASLVWTSDPGAYTLAQRFRVTSSGLYVKSVRWFIPTGSPAAPTSGYRIGIFEVGGSGSPVAVRTGTLSATIGAWNEYTLDTPLALVSGGDYRAAVLYPGGYYGAQSGLMPYDPAGPIYFYDGGSFSAGSSLQEPTTNSAAWYGIDVVVTDTLSSGETATLDLLLPVPQLSLTAPAAETAVLDLRVPMPALSLTATGPDTLSPLAAAREAVAAALSAVSGYNVRARPFRGHYRAGDGWVTVGRVAPADYTTSAVTLVVVLVLGADELAAESRLEDDAVALVDAVTRGDLDLQTADVALEPASFVVGAPPAPLYGATLTLTTEVAA
jgi:hypothetical protein